MKKLSSEVKLVGALLFIYPLFVLAWGVHLSHEKIIWRTEELLRWGGFFVLFGIFGYGVLKLNWKMRLGAIIFAVAGIAGPLLGIILAPLVNLELFFKALKMHGANVIIWEPLTIFFKTVGPIIIYLAFIIYKLSLPRVKEQFLKGPKEIV